MKTFLTGLIISLFISGPLNSQSFWEWSDPVALTDSTSNNCNAFLLNMHFSSGDVFMIWEKSTDSISTELWMNKFGDGISPEMILSEHGFHFTHPKAIHNPYANNSDSLFFLLYESNQNGNQDLHYIIYLADGSFTEPQALTSSPEDDILLTVYREYFSDNFLGYSYPIAWISGSALWGSILTDNNGGTFSEPVLIDSSVCSKPSYGEALFTPGGDGILYERADSSGTYIYKSHYEGNGAWGPAELYYDSLESRNPTRVAHYGNECWSASCDSIWRIAIQDDYWWPDTLLFSELYKSTPFDPTVLGDVQGVEDWSGIYWIAVTYPVNSVDEIYMASLYNMSWEFENFTNSGVMNRNPKFFNGEAHWNSGCWFDYLVWESFRNGHWQIWYSKDVQCVGSINENESANEFIKTYPNPFSHQTTLEFTLKTHDNVLIELFNSRGMPVTIITNQDFDQGDHQLRWDGTDLAAGIYIIKMTVGNMTYTAKLVKTQ